MKIKFFKSVRFGGDWEFNLVGRWINIRIGRSQLALWYGLGYHPLFNLLLR